MVHTQEVLFEATCRANPHVDPEHIRQVLADRPEQDRRSDEFHQAYAAQHAACPKCGALDGCATLVAYVLNMDHPDAYRDSNRFTCANCDDTHEVHERVPSAADDAI